MTNVALQLSHAMNGDEYMPDVSIPLAKEIKLKSLSLVRAVSSKC